MKKLKILVTLSILCLMCLQVFSQGYTVITTGGANEITNFITKWEDAGTHKIKNSLIYDNGTNVGIGTTSPGALLDVRGTAIFNDGSGDYDFRIEGDDDEYLFFLDAGNDRIGIGTSTPDGKLHVSTGTVGDCILRIEADINNTGGEDKNPILQFYQDGGNTIGEVGMIGSSGQIFTSSLANSLYLVNKEWAPIQFATSEIARMTITYDGKVGIGTTSPNALLDVRGDAIFNEDGGDNDFRIESNNQTHLFFVDGGNNRVGIGTSSPICQLEVHESCKIGRNLAVCGTPGTSGFELYVVGDIGYTGICQQTSDIRYKKNIETINSALDKVTSLRGVTFNFRTDEFKDMNFPEGNNYGFIAQELKKVIPELVGQNDDGYYSVNYINLAPVLAEAIKEQQKIIENQNNKIENIEKEMALLKETIVLLNGNEKNTNKDKAELIIK